MTGLRETSQTPVAMPKHLLAAMNEPNELHKSAWPKRCMLCREVFWHGLKPYQEYLVAVHEFTGC
jgi:hypothetical protein